MWFSRDLTILFLIQSNQRSQFPFFFSFLPLETTNIVSDYFHIALNTSKQGYSSCLKIFGNMSNKVHRNQIEVDE